MHNIKVHLESIKYNKVDPVI